MNNVKLSTHALNFILNQIELEKNKVLWIRSIDECRQIYLSESYNRVWERPAVDIYNHPQSFNETVITDRNDLTIQQFEGRNAQNDPVDNTVFYCIHTPSGAIKWIKDICFYLYSNSEFPLLILGIAEELSESQWRMELTHYTKILDKPKDNSPVIDFQAILEQEFRTLSNTPQKFSSPEINSRNSLGPEKEAIPLSKRQAQCLAYLKDGMTTKKMARLLNISPRTVEIHLQILLKKFSCHNRIELLSKLRDME